MVGDFEFKNRGVNCELVSIFKAISNRLEVYNIEVSGRLGGELEVESSGCNRKVGEQPICFRLRHQL